MNEGNSKVSSANLVLGAIVMTALIACFYAPYWNHFIAYKSGPGQLMTCATLMDSGLMPYKDFYEVVPPFHMIWSWIMIKLTGDHWVVLRFVSLLERVFTCLLVYLFFTKRLRFSPSTSAISIALMMITGSMDPADSIDVYSEQAIMFATMAFTGASFCLDLERSRWAVVGLAAFSGACCSMSLFTKHTIGVLSSLAIPFAMAVCLMRQSGAKKMAEYLGGFALGWLATTGSFLSWLAAGGALHDFAIDLFVNGPKAKSLSSYLSRYVQEGGFPWILIGAVTVSLSFKKIRRTLDSAAEYGDDRSRLAIALLTGLISVAVAMLTAGSAKLSTPIHGIAIVITKALMQFTWYGLAIFGSIKLLSILGSKSEARNVQTFLFIALSSAVAIAVSLSFPFYEVLLIPGEAIMLAALIEGATRRQTVAIYAFQAVTMICMTDAKIEQPYRFEDFRETNALTARSEPKTPQLKGLFLPQNTADCIDETVRIINESCAPDDRIFVYPDGALFYALTRRRPPTQSLSLNIDTSSNELCESDAQRLLQARPAVIVYYRTPEVVLLQMEKNWRQGQRSGNRSVMQACETLGAQYKLMKTFDFPDSRTGDLHIQVFVRPDRVKAAETANKS